MRKFITYLSLGSLMLLSVSGWSQSENRQEYKTLDAKPDKKAKSNAYRVGAERFGETAAIENSNANVWFNYYSTARFGSYTTSSNVIDASEQKELDSIVVAMENNVPNSYEYHYVKYWNGRNDPALFHHLEAAEKLRPNSIELYDDFIAHYEITGQDKKKAEYCQKWHQSGTIPQAVYNYNRNVLEGLPKNAILITNGETDTYPIWILQKVDKVRPDVQVLNLGLLQRDEYRQKRLKDLGLTSTRNFDITNPKHFLLDLGERNPKAELHIAMTTSPAVLTYLQHNLYLTGLAFRYSATGVDNMPQLEKNWEKKFDLNYLKNGASDEKVARLNMNYVMPALLLHQHYKQEGNTAKANELKALVKQIAQQGGKSEDVARWLGE